MSNRPDQADGALECGHVANRHGGSIVDRVVGVVLPLVAPTMGCAGSKSDVVLTDGEEAPGAKPKSTKEKKKSPAELEKEAEEKRLAEEKAKLEAEEAAKAEAAKVAAAEAEAARLAEEAAALEKARLRGCYLCFTEASGGTFQLVWSETAVEGALARFNPTKTVPQHKFVTNQGRCGCLPNTCKRHALAPAHPRGVRTPRAP